MITNNYIEKIILKRNKSQYINIYKENKNKINKKLSKKNILINGAAGTVGSSLATFLVNNFKDIKKLILIDINESELVELQRIINSLNEIIKIELIVMNVNSTLYDEYLNSNKNKIDIIFYCCALKHVRSENNIYSLKNMITTNFLSVVKHVKLLKNTKTNFFYISTDKSANPSNLMGLTKKLGEISSILFLNNNLKFKFVRFTNILISNGNIIDTTIRRILNNRAIAVPKNIYRFFITREEAVHLVLISMTLSNKYNGMVPDINIKNKYLIEDIQLQLINIFKNKFNISIKKPIFYKNRTNGEKIIEDLIDKNEDYTTDSKYKDLFFIKLEKYSEDKFKELIKEIKIEETKSINYYIRLFKKYISSFEYYKSNESLDKRY